ncbi:integrase, catalytic region, zinc finger, CCHC-type containing protein [Tanacetum coccineum]|uniref:Integrase, catalytic region, zinc finger, CCHC-type containing protein n=1 Tax=Tanacetum coccineum TaxID=301880 RepID=A0ABQ5CJV1_9ASTR
MSNSNINLQTQSSNALHNAIMEAGSKDRPLMLAPGNYVQWKSRIKRYIDTKPNSELIHYCLQNPPYTYQWAEKTVPVAEGSSETTTERYMENYKNVSQDIRDQLNAEAEAVQIILTGIDNDIYSTVDACPNACEMWKAIERLKQGESINVQDLETNLYWEFGKFTSRDGESLESYYSRLLESVYTPGTRFVILVKQKSRAEKLTPYHKLYDILKQHQNEVNEIRAKRLARTANPLVLVAQQQPVYHPQNHPTQNTQYSSTRSQQSTKNKGKAIVTSSAPTYDPEPATKAVNVARARENVGTPVVQKSGIQCYNCKEYGHVSRECQKPKRVKDAAYHKEKMLLCKQEEVGVQLNAEQADWKDDTDDESEDQFKSVVIMLQQSDVPVKPPQIITTNTLSNIKLPVLQKDDYDTWAMEMEHYLEYIDNEVWKVIQNGNSKKRVTKAWMMPKRSGSHQDMVGGNANSKEKCKKAVLKQQFERHLLSHLRTRRKSGMIGLQNSYHTVGCPWCLTTKWTHLLPWHLIIGVSSQAKASSSKHKPSHSSGSYSSYATSSSKATPTATPGLADEVIHSFLDTNADDVDLIHEDLDQIDDLDLEEMDINWQIAMTAIKIKKF